MATRQQLTDAIDKAILKTLTCGEVKFSDLEKIANAVSSLVYARGDILRQAREEADKAVSTP